MHNEMTQEERLEYLVKAFRDDSRQYRDIAIPDDSDNRRRLLRSLMNIRMPAPLSAEILAVQDEYLQERLKESGIVTVDEIPVSKDGFSLWQGDITRIAADAIVNAANSQMLGCFIPMHTCIDNCIHTYAGVQLRAECARHMGRMRRIYGRDYEQPVAVPILTDAYNLPARKVIHIAGPIVQYELTEQNEKDLAACYENALDLCLENGLKTIAFCCISTGVFHFPGKRAAEIAVSTVSRWMKNHPAAVERVIFNVFKDEDRSYYEALLY